MFCKPPTQQLVRSHFLSQMAFFVSLQALHVCNRPMTIVMPFTFSQRPSILFTSFLRSMIYVVSLELPWSTTPPLFFNPYFSYLLFILHTSHVGHHQTFLIFQLPQLALDCFILYLSKSYPSRPFSPHLPHLSFKK